MRPRTFVLLLPLACAACATHTGSLRSPPDNLERSDARATKIADAVMETLGGRAAWERTRYVTFNVGQRRYLWDRSTGLLRLERPGPRSGKPYVIVLNVDSGAGRAWRAGQEVVEPSELNPMLDAGRREWINDSPWLLMPYRLQDHGVMLHVLGEGQTQEGRAADVLEVTFTIASAAPQPKYHLWVARESGLIEQWSGYAERGSEEPAWTCPWKDWKRYGSLMLCGDHGELGGQPMELTDIAVPDSVPASVFESPEAVDWDAMLEGR